ncbi:Peptide transport system permease protein SapC [Candidatus Providencia siddallii]|uniref:Peptide transport system permease protein SapC n=1 Tax=Candidatus Providencia siddallii TaxID=1715285 RepID=A0A0M6W8V5_9GAMM|nr:Peptide transport system permease protein SapC [Candidatus Providencia siddallii]
MFLDNFYTEKKIPSQLSNIRMRLSSDISFMIGFFCVLLLLIVCCTGQYLAPYAFDQQFVDYKLISPSWLHYGKNVFFLGTDNFGHDLLSRLLIGTKYTFGSALLVTFIAIVFGLVIGSLAGITKGFKSVFLNHILDILLFIPSLLLTMIVVIFIGVSFKNAMLAICLSLIPRMVRIICLVVHDELDKEYIVSVRLDGASNTFILLYNIIPNIIHILILESTRAFSIAIFDIASFSFLGLAAKSSSCEWGVMLKDSLDLIYIAPWCVIAPCVAIMFCILFINLFGNGLFKAINSGIK